MNPVLSIQEGYQLNEINEINEVEAPETFIDESYRTKIFSDSIVQLQLNLDSIHELFKSLISIINYVPCDYQLLYVKNDELCYYTPKSYYGSYFYGNEVLIFIENKIETIFQVFEEIELSKKWKVLKIISQTLEGLQKIIDNYSINSTYKSFVDGLKFIYDNLSQFVSEQKDDLNKPLNLFLQQGLLPKDYFHLLSFYAFSYPKSLIIKILSENYCPRLVLEIFKDHEDEFILHENAYKILFSIATLVTKEDLEWHYNQLQNENKNFNELSINELHLLLKHYRYSLEGFNLLEYFHIPITSDKFNIDPIFLEMNRSKNIFEENLMCEINVYCDLMSYVIWQPCELVHISPVQMYDHLNRFFESPLNPHLFHTDRYINFLTVATAIFSYYKYSKNEEERIERFNTIIEQIKLVLKNCNEIYPNDTEKYKFCWNRLLGELNNSIRNPNYDLGPYYKSLITHPLEEDANKDETLKYYSLLQPYEFLGRRIAYWNRYYQESNFYVDSSNKLKDISHITQRVGTLIYLPNTHNILEINKIIFREGFICQIALGCKKESNLLEIYFLFQGTIENDHSKKRDYFLKGAGYDLWQQEKGNLLLDELIPLINDLNKNGNLQFKLHFIGHSLGGSDAQNALSFLGEAFVASEIDKNLINEINMHTFNSAGVPKDTIDRFNLNFKNYAYKICHLTHSIVKHDLVSKSNDGKLGLHFKESDKVKIIEVSNLGLYYFINNHCDYIYSCTNNILPHRILDHKNEQHNKLIEKYLYGAIYSWTNLGIHLQDIKNSNPYLKAISSLVMFATFSYLNAQLTPISQTIIYSAGSLSQGGVGMLRSAGDNYTRNHMKGAIGEIQEAAYRSWYGSQILEGTG